MKQRFAIKGLTCASCEAKVRELLTPVVGQVRVSHRAGLLEVVNEKPVSVEVLNEALAGTKYRVAQLSLRHRLRRRVRPFVPLIMISGLVVIFGLGHAWWTGFSFHTVMQYLMAGYFLVFGALKVLNWRGFVGMYRQYDAIARRVALYAWLYPALEVGLGVLYYLDLWTIPLNLFVFLLMLEKAESVYQKLQEPEVVTCACLGGWFRIPVTRVTLGEDILMALMALTMLFMVL